MKFRCSDCGCIRKKCVVTCIADISFTSSERGPKDIRIHELKSKANFPTMTRQCLSCGGTNVKVVKERTKR